MIIDKTVVAKVRDLKGKYKISSRAAYKFLKKRDEYERWVGYIDERLKAEGAEPAHKSTWREVANLYRVSIFMTACVIGHNNFEADHREAILNFYRTVNKTGINPRNYGKATNQLVPPEIRVDGKNVQLACDCYSFPGESRVSTVDGFEFIDWDFDQAEFPEDIIDRVTNRLTEEEVTYLFSEYHETDIEPKPTNEVYGSMERETVDRLNIDWSVNPVYLRAERAHTLYDRDTRRSVALNWMIAIDDPNVDGAIQAASEQLFLVRRELEDDGYGEYLKTLNINLEDEKKVAPYKIKYYEYLIRTLKGNRRFLETKMREMKDKRVA